MIDFLIDFGNVTFGRYQFLDRTLPRFEHLEQSVAQFGAGGDLRFGVDYLFGHLVAHDIGGKLLGSGILCLILKQRADRAGMGGRDCQLERTVHRIVGDAAVHVHADHAARTRPLLFAKIGVFAHQFRQLDGGCFVGIAIAVGEFRHSYGERVRRRKWRHRVGGFRHFTVRRHVGGFDNFGGNLVIGYHRFIARTGAGRQT